MLFSLYKGLVLYWCRQKGVPSEDQPDLVQEIFRSVFKDIDRFESRETKASFRPWLRTIASRRIDDYYRQNGRLNISIQHESDSRREKENILTIAEIHDVEAVNEWKKRNRAGNDEDVIVLCKALELVECQFDEKTWTAFYLMNTTETTSREIGEKLGLKPETVRQMSRRVLAKLKTDFAELIDLDGFTYKGADGVPQSGDVS